MFERNIIFSTLQCEADTCFSGSDAAATMGACDATSGDTFGTCVACTKTDGTAGDGTTAGTCDITVDANTKCHADGSCNVCTDDGTGDAASPHSGCDQLNPVCDTTATPLVCQCGAAACATDSTSNICGGADGTTTNGACRCGGDGSTDTSGAELCSGGTPNCYTSDGAFLMADSGSTCVA